MYRVLQPAPELSPYIESYWVVDASAGPVDLRVDVFVDARADLIFTFGAPYQRQVIGGDPQAIAWSNLDAQRLVPIRITQSGLVRLFGVRFKLGGLGVFVRSSLRPFTDGTHRPDQVFGDDARALEAALERSTGDADAASLLDAFFLTHRVGHEGRAEFEAALAALHTHPGAAAVRDVASEVGVTGRQVERLFARHLGVAPKVVARVVRFQRSLRALMQDTGIPLAQVALDCGYFDQAHFIREFRKMNGGVPRGYRGYYPPQAPTDFAPNVVAFVQDGPRRA